MSQWLERFETCIVWIIAVMTAGVVVLATIDLAVTLGREIARPPVGLVPITGVLDIFGMLLLLRIGVELVETLRAYLVDHVIRVEVVFMVALIAMARKVIILELTKLPASSVVALALLIAALSGGYYIVRRSHSDELGGPPLHP